MLSDIFTILFYINIDYIHIYTHLILFNVVAYCIVQMAII